MRSLRVGNRTPGTLIWALGAIGSMESTGERRKVMRRQQWGMGVLKVAGTLVAGSTVSSHGHQHASHVRRQVAKAVLQR